MTRFGALCLVAFGVGLGVTAGCGDRLHMSSSYGRAYHESFVRQIARPEAGEQAKTPKGLDAQEAAIVVDTYRKQLAPKGSGSSDSQPILVLPPSAGSQSGYLPPPSVPQGR